MKGTPSTKNYPGARHDGAHWVDKDGNFWLFGGIGYDSADNLGKLNDLWKYDVTAGEWTWVSGSSTLPTSNQCPSCGRPGAYGSLTKAASDNTPGARIECINWTDENGNLWLFGGQGYDSAGDYGGLNDLWMLSPSSGQWAWMGGSDTVPTNSNPGSGNMSSIGGSPGVYGVLGKPAVGNVPGGRGGAANWADSSGNLWLLGGYGWITPSNLGDLNDLWEYSTSTNEWAWMGGSDLDPPATGIDAGVYGKVGISSSSNIPAGRDRPVSWTHPSGNFWLFGGDSVNRVSSDPVEEMNDLWMFDPSTQEWTWEGGSNSSGQTGTYGTLGVPGASQIPGARAAAIGWTDASGNLWLFGGVDQYPTGPSGVFNDLWVFNPSANVWAWMGGTAGIPNAGHCQPCGTAGIYGALEIADPKNMPGSRYDAASWVDSAGNFWIFGGWGIDSNEQEYPLNDLWKYVPLAPAWSAAIPGFSRPGGTYSSAQTVSIAEATPKATIYYTIDGTTPTTDSPQYDGALTISKTTTVKAFAAASGLPNSATVEAVYTILYPQSISFSLPQTHVTYGIRAIPLAAKATSGLPVIFGVISGPASVNGAKLSVHGAGEIVIAANQSGSSNYRAAPQVEQTIRVDKALLTVTPRNAVKTYGKGHPAFTYTISGFVNNDTEAHTVTGVPSLRTTATRLSPVGSYPIEAALGSLASRNYSIQFKEGVLRVEKAELTVTAKSEVMKQGQEPPPLRYVINGFVNGDTPKAATTGEPKLTTTATSKSKPGKYPIVVNVSPLKAENYSFEPVNGTLTVQ